ncbi:PAS domain S-box protein [Rhodocytophaga rosea]|uniref:PAS domain S-box protein n=1 Tax=Rhodocytophaga rosea TaxID=2704465 RepID=A0A6C0GUJ1_9BACT|nr:PAS domain S-box protein [Rhodocytophaga rosea]QHT71527.1 PAS domain S-box protein [Rhodocytophaga rosea]
MNATSTSRQASEKEIQPFIEEIRKQIDKVTEYFLIGYFIFGLLLSFFYDTYLMGIGVGGLCLFAFYFTKYILPASSLYQYVVSVTLAVFMAQFIYQMHGLFEMHFFAFLGAVLLIAYQEWKLQIPLILLIVLHHGSLAYLQYIGYSQVYFTQLDYMSLQAFVFHALLASAIVFVCGLWAYFLRKRTRENAINTLLLRKQLANTDRNIAFAEEISKGNLQINYAMQEGDELGKSLMNMQQSLLKASQKEEQEKFVNMGIADVGHILRNANTDMNALSIELIRKIVKYLGANQGGLFVWEENELVLRGCYAYDRVKYGKKSIKKGEGLLGQVLLEKDTLYMTDLPTNYIQITSGLGYATPRSLLIVPLKNNDEVVGAIEIASFEEIPAYKIGFMETIGAMIASSILTAQGNEQKAKLLEEFQAMNEQLRSQEEEMRQNMEELEATQEEMRRNEQAHLQEIGRLESEYQANTDQLQKKDLEISGVLSAVNSTLAMIEFDLKGTILTANERFLQVMGYSLEEITGKHHSMFVEKAYKGSNEYNTFWQDLTLGEAQLGDVKRITKHGMEVYLNASYTPVFDQQGQVSKIIKFAQVVNQEKEIMLAYQSQLQTITELNTMAQLHLPDNTVSNIFS